MAEKKQKLKALRKASLAAVSLLLLFLALALFASEKKSPIAGSYDYEEYSPAATSLSRYFALYIKFSDNKKQNAEKTVQLAAADLAMRLGQKKFAVLSSRHASLNAEAARRWQNAFNVRNQNISMHINARRKDRINGLFAIVYIYSHENEQSRYARSAGLPKPAKAFDAAAIRTGSKQEIIGPNLEDKISADYVAALGAAPDERILYITLQPPYNKGPFLAAIDCANRAAQRFGYSYFIITGGKTHGDLSGMQVSVRYLRSPVLPEDLLKRGYKSFMVHKTQ